MLFSDLEKISHHLQNANDIDVKAKNVTSKDYSLKVMFTFKFATSVAAFAITAICATVENAADNITDAANSLGHLCLDLEQIATVFIFAWVVSIYSLVFQKKI